MQSMSRVSLHDEKMAVPHAETGMVSGYPDSDYSKSKSDIAERSPVFNVSSSTSSTVTSTATSTTALTVSSRTPSQFKKTSVCAFLAENLKMMIRLRSTTGRSWRSSLNMENLESILHR